MPFYNVYMMSKTQTKKAIKWARKRLTELLAETVKRGPEKGQKIWPVQSAHNQVLKEAQREFNIGCAKAIEKALKISTVDETEEEIAAWEAGLDTPEEKQADADIADAAKISRSKSVRIPLSKVTW